MEFATPATWTDRYRTVLVGDQIRDRVTIRGVRAEGLAILDAEVACSRLELELKRIFLPTKSIYEIIRMQVERALAHSEITYVDPRIVLRDAYAGGVFCDPYMPTLLTGPAGVGKSAVRRAIARLLSGRSSTQVDPYHPGVPLVDYVDCVVGSKKSISAIMRPFASPEIAGGRVRIIESDLLVDCARWLRVCGTCLLGADELQFLAQSTSASTLISRVLMDIAEVRVPWFAIANYSMCWKLCGRSVEAKQRLLGFPVVLLPDSPDSPDWLALLAEYGVVAEDYFDFRFVDYGSELWNLCVGLKRELLKLLVHAYRIARRSGRGKACWSDVQASFASAEYSESRKDVNLLISHAAQGGSLRYDLCCPFGAASADAQQRFASDLRAARGGVVARAVIHSAMNATEKAAIAGLEKLNAESNGLSNTEATPKRKRVTSKKTLDNLLDSGRRARERRGQRPPA